MINDKDIEAAIKLFERGEYVKCLPVIEAAASQNNLRALETYGLIIQYGLGIKRDIGKAIEILEKAVALGSSVAAHNLGTLYQTSDFPETESYEKSDYWFQKAREMGFDVSS
ncbi:MAG: hypothetical protein MI808_08745 [Pseudomonadales bacterium]|nr:hypothetical protein [Pseudomonadales bacterium]